MEQREPLINKEQTARRMKMLIGRYAKDLDRIKVKSGRSVVPFSKLSTTAVHSLVKNIPYKKDKEPIEIIARPARLLNGEFYYGLDCKKKAIILGAWAVKNRIPYRLIASSKRADKKYHHVFPQIRVDREWINFDATYRNMLPGEVKRVTAATVL